MGHCRRASNERSQMPDKQPVTFESKIARLEAIVSELESGNIELDKTIVLFKEGKTLARECDQLLKSAQEQIDRAMQGTDAVPVQPEKPDNEIPF